MRPLQCVMRAFSSEPKAVVPDTEDGRGGPRTREQDKAATCPPQTLTIAPRRSLGPHQRHSSLTSRLLALQARDAEPGRRGGLR
eukprot:885932-Prymnesium_polylepis.2